MRVARVVALPSDATTLPTRSTPGLEELLPNHANTQLQAARVGRFGNRAGVRIRDVRIRLAEVDVVERVIDIEPDVEAPLAADGEVLCQRKIGAPEIG